MQVFSSGFPDIGPLELGKYAERAVEYMFINWKPFLYVCFFAICREVISLAALVGIGARCISAGM